MARIQERRTTSKQELVELISINRMALRAAEGDLRNLGHRVQSQHKVISNAQRMIEEYEQAALDAPGKIKRAKDRLEQLEKELLDLTPKVEKVGVRVIYELIGTGYSKGMNERAQALVREVNAGGDPKVLWERFKDLRA